MATCALILALTTAAGLYAPNLIFRIETQRTALAELSRQNEELRREKERFERTLAEIAGQLNEFETQSGRLADALGVEDLPSSRPAAGGPGAATAPVSRRSLLEDELDALKNRSDTLDESLEQIVGAFEHRRRMLDSTPSVMPVDGWFSHGFGWRKDPFTGERQFHRGIDIVADAGTPVLATADGVVSRAVRVPDYGKMIDISNGFGYVTRFGHLSEIMVRPGQRVRRGDVIGLVGSTGRSTGPHVHYEVFRDGRRVNPWKYLGQR